MTQTPVEATPNSILDDTKIAIGMTAEQTEFNADLVLHINSVLADLHQMGIGPDEGYSIVNAADTWDEFIETEKRLNNVKSYIFLRVKMLFDPPSVGYVLTSLEKMIEKAEWRLTVAADEIKNPLPPETVTDEEDIFGDESDEPSVVDGGSGW
jgi:hypothetical protein